MATVQADGVVRGLPACRDCGEIMTPPLPGISSLKSLSPTREAVAGDVCGPTIVVEPLITLTTANHQMSFSLVQARRLAWLPEVEPCGMIAGLSHLTALLVLGGGQCLDPVERAKTKRSAVNLAARVGKA